MRERESVVKVALVSVTRMSGMINSSVTITLSRIGYWVTQHSTLGFSCIVCGEYFSCREVLANKAGYLPLVYVFENQT